MTRDDKPLLFIVRTLWLPLIPKTSAEVKDYLSEKFPFSDGAFQPDAERFLKIGLPINGDPAVRFHAAEFRRNASGEYHYTGQTIPAVTFDLSEVAGATRTEMIFTTLARFLLPSLSYALSATIFRRCARAPMNYVGNWRR